MLKFKDVSHEMLVLRLQHVWSRFFGLLVESPCLWGKLRNFEGFKTGCNESNILHGTCKVYSIKCRVWSVECQA